MDGWITLHRKITETLIWNKNEPFDARSAWIDLLMLANFKDSRALVKNHPVTVKRGQCIVSLRFLSERWKWGKTKVNNFLSLLEEEQMIIASREKNETLLTVVNYEKYQVREDSSETLGGHEEDSSETLGGHEEDSSETLGGHEEDKEKECINKDNKVNNVTTKNNNENILSNTDVLDRPSEADKKSGRQFEYDRIVKKWNELSIYGIPPIRKIAMNSSDRTKLTNARLREYSLEDFLGAIERIKQSDWLKGNHDGSTWQITYDWFVKPSNFPRVLEGNYDNRTRTEHRNNGNGFERYSG